jgi:BetR domain
LPSLALIATLSVMSQSTADRTTDRHIGLVVRTKLSERHESQAWLARRIGMTTHSLSRRIRGETHWRPAELNDVAEVLGVPVEQLLGGS